MEQISMYIGAFKSHLITKHGNAKADIIFQCIAKQIDLQADIFSQAIILLQQCENSLLAAENPEVKPVHTPITSQLVSDECTITGRVVRLSDVGNNRCKRGSTLYIFATETIVIDADFNDVGGERSVYVLAPKWEVTQMNVKINLNGTSGSDPMPNTAANGENGAPGTYGGAAGNFFGLGLAITNGVQLKIHAVGGQGGNGQNGGQGKPNVIGATPKMPTDTKQHDFFSRDSCDLLIYQADINGYDLSPRGVYRLFGADDGGNGGNGGRQGEGGQKGEVLVIFRDEQSVEVLAKDGEDGFFGLGGSAGKNSVYGDDVYFTCTMLTSGIDKKSYKFKFIDSVSGGPAKGGKDGAEDYFSPSLPKKVGPRPHQLVDVFAKYKSLCDPTTNPCSNEFLEFFQHSSIRRSIDTYEHMPQSNAARPVNLYFAPVLLFLIVIIYRIWRRTAAISRQF